MAIVVVPVSSFSRKILLSSHLVERNVSPPNAEKTFEVISVHGAEGLFQYLCCRKPIRIGKTQRLKSELNTTIAFSISTERSAEISKNVWQIGLCLQEVHRERFFEYICAKQEENVPIKCAIEQFCKRYGICIDEDITMDTLLKTYQRHLQEMNIAAFYNNKNTVLSPQIEIAPLSILLLSDEALDIIISDCEKKDSAAFVTAKGNVREIRKRQLAVHVYYHQGNRSVKDICHKFGMTETTVYATLRSYSMFLKKK